MTLKSLIQCKSKWHSLLLSFLGGRLDSPADRQQLTSGRCGVCVCSMSVYWASEASPTLGCSIEISRDICMSVCLVCQINCVGGIT